MRLSLPTIAFGLTFSPRSVANNMNHRTVIVTLLVVGILAAIATPASATAQISSDARLTCTGEPTSIPRVDDAYQNGCESVGDVCDFVFGGNGTCPFN